MPLKKKRKKLPAMIWRFFFVFLLISINFNNKTWRVPNKKIVKTLMEYFRKILVFAENTIFYDVTFSYLGEYVVILFFTFHSCMHKLLAYQLHSSCLAIHFRCSLFKYYYMTCLKGIPKINCSANFDLERILLKVR